MAKKLFVGNLSWNVTDEELQKEFSAFGEITECKIITDRESNRSKGFGFVSFENDDEAEKAIEEMNGKEIDGRAIVVNEARPKKENGGRQF